MKFAVTPAESAWLNLKMGQLSELSQLNEDTLPLAHTANKIRYNTDGAPPYVFLTRPQRALVVQLAHYRFQSLDLVPCEERDVVVSLIKKVAL